MQHGSVGMRKTLRAVFQLCSLLMCDILRTFPKFLMKCSAMSFAYGAYSITPVCSSHPCLANFAKHSPLLV